MTTPDPRLDQVIELVADALAEVERYLGGDKDAIYGIEHAHGALRALGSEAPQGEAVVGHVTTMHCADEGEAPYGWSCSCGAKASGWFNLGPAAANADRHRATAAAAAVAPEDPEPAGPGCDQCGAPGDFGLCPLCPRCLWTQPPAPAPVPDKPPAPERCGAVTARVIVAGTPGDNPRSQCALTKGHDGDHDYPPLPPQSPAEQVAWALVDLLGPDKAGEVSALLHDRDLLPAPSLPVGDPAPTADPEGDSQVALARRRADLLAEAESTATRERDIALDALASCRADLEALRAGITRLAEEYDRWSNDPGRPASGKRAYASVAGRLRALLPSPTPGDSTP